jgi:hypothetical protein
MADDTANGAGGFSQWQRIARLLLSARSSVIAQGAGVIVKWDGQRDASEMYTVVREGDPDSGPRFRMNTDDLEHALGQAFSIDKDVELESVALIAELLAKVDAVAHQCLVIGLRMSRSKEALNNRITILGDGNKGLLFDQQSHDLVTAIGEAVRFIEKRIGLTARRIKHSSNG